MSCNAFQQSKENTQAHKLSKKKKNSSKQSKRVRKLKRNKKQERKKNKKCNLKIKTLFQQNQDIIHTNK